MGGAYGLEFLLTRRVETAVGSLGFVTLPAGLWRYFGSAKGPGGLRSRVLRHLDSRNRAVHWHVDRLTAAFAVRRVLIVPGGHECDLVKSHLEAGWEAPVKGFGSSDCSECPAHLLRRPAR